METLQRLHNRGSISTGEYEIDNSLKLEADNSERLYFTPGSSGNRKTWTYSCWFKRTELDKYCMLMGTADTYMYIDQYGGDMHIRLDKSGATGGNYLYTTPVYRDTSAWYHFVLAVDTTQATAANRAKFYVNGVQVTDFATEVYPAQNADTDWNFTNAHYVGGWSGATYDSSGYLAEVHSVDGQQLAPTEFGEVDSNSGIWKPKEYTGTYGTNGFYLEFENSADLGDDTSGNNKNFVLQNITSADQATDSPTNNFCTMSPIINFRQKEPVTKFCTNGATYIQDDSSNSWRAVMGSVFLTKGKWYWEVKNQWSTNGLAGIHTFRGNPGTTTSPHGVNDSFYFVYNKSGSGAHMAKYIDGTATSPVGSYETAFNHNDYACFSLDLDNDTLTVTQNGSSAGTSLTDVDISSITALGPVAPLMSIYRYSMRTIFGGFSTDALTSPYQDENGYGNFKYAVPSGFYAICSKNLAEYG